MKKRSHSFLGRSSAVSAAALLCLSAGIGGSLLGLLRTGAALVPEPAAISLFPAAPLLNPNDLSATSAILLDPADGRILFQKNAGTQQPLASLTKLMTAEIVLTFESPNNQVTITPDDLTPYGNSGLNVGDTPSLRSLIAMGLIASSNDAMQAAAESLGSDYLGKMNTTAKNLGLSKTRFLNPTGLDINATTSGAYGSAFDVARLAALFYKSYPDYFELSARSAVSIDDTGRTLTASTTAAPLLTTPGFIGAKTGYTELAGGNLVALFDIEIGHPLVAVVLGSTEAGRFADIRTIINAARSAAAHHAL